MLQLDALHRVDAGQVAEVGEAGGGLEGQAVHGVHSLNDALRAAHLSLGLDVLPWSQPELLHQILWKLGVVWPSQEAAFDLAKKGVRTFGLGVQHALDADQALRRVHLRRRSLAAPGDARRAGLRRPRLMGRKLGGGEEDLGLLAVGAGGHPVGLTVRGEEDGCATPTTSTPPPAAAASEGAWSISWWAGRRRTPRRRSRRLVGAVVLPIVVRHRCGGDLRRRERVGWI